MEEIMDGLMLPDIRGTQFNRIGHDKFSAAGPIVPPAGKALGHHDNTHVFKITPGELGAGLQFIKILFKLVYQGRVCKDPWRIWFSLGGVAGGAAPPGKGG